MGLLAALAYDPTGGAAVSKDCASRIAMTAIDTTNCRLSFVAPPNGIVQVRLKGQVHGATTFPRILLGVLDGATVKLRMAPTGHYSGTPLATTQLAQECIGLVTGLTAGTTYTWDAAYGVEILLSSTGLKYGGPNDTTTNNAFGAFIFEVWSTENLLAGKLYDPASAATLATTSLLAMTAIDTTNLRLTFTAPSSGAVLWRVKTQTHGSTTFGQILLGILDGATLKARSAPVMAAQQTALATACISCEAGGIISNLTPGTSYTYDAAYGVEIVGGSGAGIKHGGPDNTTTDDAFGGTAFEIWAA